MGFISSACNLALPGVDLWFLFSTLRLVTGDLSAGRFLDVTEVPREVEVASSDEEKDRVVAGELS